MFYVDKLTGREYVPQTGDALNWHWETAVPGWVIAEFEGDDYTHTSVVVVDVDGVAWSIGAEASGVTPTKLSDIDLDANTIEVLRPNFNYGPDAPPEGWQVALTKQAFSDCGVLEYGYYDLLANMWRQTLDPQVGDDPPEWPKKVICAMYVVLLWRRFRHWRGCPDILASSISPGNLDDAARRGAWLKVQCNRLVRV